MICESKHLQRGRLPAGGALIVIAIGAFLGGCAPSLPRHAIRSPAESLEVIAERLSGIESIQAGSTVELGGEQGEGQVRLDAALVARPPDALRLRAWKFDRVVFDATLTGGELWLLTGEGVGPDADRLDPDAVATGLRRALHLFSPEFYRQARVDPGRTDDDRLVVEGAVESIGVTCEIHRPTLTPRRFGRTDGGPESALAIGLEDYRVVDGVVFPCTWVIVHPGGRIRIRMDTIELNGEVAEAALTPPRRATRRP